MRMSRRERHLENQEVRVYARSLRTSSRKLNEVVATIRGKSAGEAINILSFSRRRIASSVLKVLQSAIASAENNYLYDVDLLYVSSASVGKGLRMRRVRPSARGRASRYSKEFSNLEIILSVSEMAE